MATLRISTACTEFGRTFTVGQIVGDLSGLQSLSMVMSELATLVRGELPLFPSEDVFPITSVMFASPATYGLEVVNGVTYEFEGLRYSSDGAALLAEQGGGTVGPVPGLGLKADKTTAITAGDGLMGGGDLSADRALAIQLDPAGDASLTVGAAGLKLASTNGNTTSPDGQTYVKAVNGQIQFFVGNTQVGSVEIDTGTGLPKWNQDGLLDPVSYIGTPQTIAQRNALSTALPAARHIVMVVDTGVNEYQWWNGTAWSAFGATVPAATVSALGTVQLADAAAITAGTAGRVVDAAQLKAAADLKADKATALTAGDGLSGGGDLSANRTVSVLLDPTTDSALSLSAAGVKLTLPAATTVVNDLTTGGTTAALSAQQGVVLTAADVASGAVAGNDLTLTLKGGGTVVIDVTSLAADVKVVSGSYNATTEEIDFVCDPVSANFSVPVAALLPVTVGDGLTGNGSTTALSVLIDPASNTALSVSAAGLNLALLGSNVNPLADGTADPGTGTAYSREDHVHPTDTALIPLSTIDAKGDLLVGTADNVVARLAVGADGQKLVAASAEATGVKWVNDAAREWVSTTNNMTLVVGGQYILQAGHTVTFPTGAIGDSILIIPANGNWATLGATLTPAVGWTIGAGQSAIPATADMATFAVNAAANWLVAVGGASAPPVSTTPPKVTRITASGSFTPDPLAKYAIVEAVGGGGGSAAGSGATVQASGGGGGGGHMKVMFTAAQMGAAAKAVVIGAGADTTFGGTLVVAKAGSASGSNNTNGVTPQFAPGGNGGAVGTFTTGTLIEASPGGAGGTAFIAVSGLPVASSGFGGASRFGGSLPGLYLNTSGNAPGVSGTPGTGQGASGSARTDSGGYLAIPGSTGSVIVTEHYN
jgi:hypothetical protein